MLGLGVGAGVELAVPTLPAGASTKTITVSTAKVPNLGTVLTTASGLTLYHFTEDPSGGSACTGACAKIWPPMLASKGAHIKGPKGVRGLSLIKVGNGHWQVAFHNDALYRFDGDKKKGQAKGQGVAHVWFAVLKSGIPAAGAATAAPGATTSTSAPGTTTTQPVTPATPPPSSSPQAPMTQSTAPPPTTTPPPPPTTTPTTTGGNGGVGF